MKPLRTKSSILHKVPSNTCTVTHTHTDKVGCSVCDTVSRCGSLCSLGVLSTQRSVHNANVTLRAEYSKKPLNTTFTFNPFQHWCTLVAWSWTWTHIGARFLANQTELPGHRRCPLQREASLNQTDGKLERQMRTYETHREGSKIEKEWKSFKSYLSHN